MELRAAAMESKAWPYEEARKLLKRYPTTPEKGYVLFETGYGPSGLPRTKTWRRSRLCRARPRWTCQTRWTEWGR